MKIKVIHTECGRESLVQQVIASQGHCPWDGKPFDNDYTAVLTEALETAEAAGDALENALEKMAGLGPALRLDEASVVGPLRESIARMGRISPE